MGKRIRITLPTLLLMLALASMCSAQNAKTSAAERDFQRFDGNQSGWLSGRELIECQCKSYDNDGDNEVTKAEFFAGRGLPLQSNKLTDDDGAPAQKRKTFKVGDRVEADPLLIDQWRKGRVAKLYLTDAGEINVYEIKFDTGVPMLVRADSNAVRPPSGGENDETAAATSSPELSVTARQVYDDYHNNRLAAKRKYVGKVVKVTGKLWIIQYSEIVRSYVDLTAHDYGSDVTCFVVDKEQLASLNKGETVSIVGTVSGAYSGSDSVSVEPCRILPADAATKNAQPAAPADQTRNQPPRNAGGVVGSWYYIALVNADGSETGLNNRESLLNLKADGTFENSLGVAGRGSQIGTYSVSGNRLTLNAENREPRTYTITFGDDGKRTFSLSGKTLTLINKDGIGYKLER